MGVDKRYRLVVFDLDGTLIDTRPDIARAFSLVVTEAGFSAPDIAQVTAAIGCGAQKALCRLTGLDMEHIAPLHEAFLQKYEEICADHTVVYEGAEALLNRLAAQGAVLAVVTMKAKAPTHKILAAHGLCMFDEVIAFEDMAKPKPDPDTLNILMEKYGILPGDTLMIGDTVTDMRFAAAAGVDACAMEHGYGVMEDVLAEHPRYVLNSFLEF